MERESVRGVPYHQPADTAVADEDVRAEPEEEEWRTDRARLQVTRICQEHVSGGGIVQQVRRPSDLERRIGRASGSSRRSRTGSSRAASVSMRVL